LRSPRGSATLAAIRSGRGLAARRLVSGGLDACTPICVTGGAAIRAGDWRLDGYRPAAAASGRRLSRAGRRSLSRGFFVHTAFSPTIDGGVTYLNHPLLNNNPNAIFLATQNWNPYGDQEGVYNQSEIGAYYSNTEKRWTVFNEDATGMTENASFNIYIPPSGSTAQVHTTTGSNISSSWTTLDDPLLNDNSTALVFALHDHNPGGGAGNYFNHHLGVWFAFASRWAIFNQDSYTMPVGVSFNVYFRTEGLDAFRHTATADNSEENYTYLDHPLLNGRPGALMIVTPNFEPNSVLNDYAIGVWYDVSLGRWGIFNQADAPIAPGASFNVLVAEPNVYLPQALK
jgi:hypothetical protein